MGEQDAVPLREHFEAKIADLEARTTERFAASEKAVATAFAAAKEAVTAAMAAAEKAVAKAEAASDKRAEASNEIRAAMIDQQKNFADKEKTDFRLAALERMTSTSVGQSKGIGMIVLGGLAALSTLTSIAALFYAISK